MSHCFTSKDFVVKSFEKYKFYPFDQVDATDSEI